MQLKFLAVILLAPFALTAPAPIPNSIDNVIGRPTHTIQERQAPSSSIISTIISAALPIIEKLLSSLLPTIEKMIASALAKRSDGSLVYEIQVPHGISEHLKE